MPKIAVLAGSTRRDSINRKLAGALVKLGEDRLEPVWVRIDDLPSARGYPVPAQHSRPRQRV